MNEWRVARRKKLLDYLRRADEAGTPTIAAAKGIANSEHYQANGTAWVMALGAYLGMKAKQQPPRPQEGEGE